MIDSLKYVEYIVSVRIFIQIHISTLFMLLIIMTWIYTRAFWNHNDIETNELYTRIILIVQ